MEMQPFTVRVIYVVPKNADPWGETKQRATDWLEDIQWFFADEMDRLGYGPKTFQIALDEGGALDFHQFNSPETKKQFEQDPNGSCKRVLGGRLRNEEDAEVCFFEAYSISQGVVSGVVARASRRRCYLSSLHLKLARREWMANDEGYGGQVFPWISLEPMKSNTLSWNGRGRKLGDVSGAAFGAMAHELAHCFGPNDHKSEDDVRQRKGNLMDKGFRGMRGYFRPGLTDDRCVLSKEDAVLLDGSPFFVVRDLKPKSPVFGIDSIPNDLGVGSHKLVVKRTHTSRLATGDDSL
jgi:hypothetical protein